MAKQFALQNALADGGAVDLLVIRFPAVRQVMQAGCNQLLACTPLTNHKHWFLKRCDARYALQYLHKRGCFADDAFRVLGHRATPKLYR